MAKNIIKEIIIMLLLCLAIILILGVILYEYVPSNKILPEEVSYVTPQNIKEELNSSNSVEEDKVILTYEIDESDLANYQRIKDYKPGKGKYQLFKYHKSPNRSIAKSLSTSAIA